MANNEYLIPFGIDGGPFFKTLNEMDAGVDRMASSAGTAAKELSKGFQESAEAGNKLTKVIDADEKQLNKLKDTAGKVGRELGAALSGKNIGTDFDNKIKGFTDLMTRFAAQANKPVKFNVDTAKLEMFENLISEGANEVEVLNQVLAHTKEVMAGLDPQSAEFAELAEQVELADGFLKEFGQAADGVETKGKTLKTQLRSIKEEMAALELAGHGNTDEFRALALRAGELEDQIGDVSARVRVLASDTKNIDAAVGAISALAGGFTAAQGAIALFGDENEEVNKIIQKVTGAMAVLQGVQALANALNKDSALSVLLFSRAQQTAAVSTAGLAAAEVAEAGAAGTATTATNAFTAALLANPITAVLVAITAVVAALIAFSGSSKDAKEATDDFNNSLERNQTLLSLDEQALKRRTDLQVAQAKRSGAAESEIMKIEGNAAIERLRIREQSLETLKQQYNEGSASGKIAADDLKKLNTDILKSESEVADIRNEIQIKRLNVIKQLSDEEKSAAEKREAQQKKSLEAAKKDAVERKAIIDQQLKFAKELRDATVDAIKNNYEKERAQARENLQDRVETLNNEKALSKKAIEDRNALIVQLRKNLQTQLAEIDEKEKTDRAILEFQAQQTLVDLQTEGLSKQIDLLHVQFEERRRAINEQYKNETALRQQLIEGVNAAEIEAETKARNVGRLQAIKDNEENQILQVETAAKFLGNFPKMEEQKNIAVLEVRLKYAKLTLKALEDQGESETSTVVLQAKKQIQELGKALKDGQKDLKGDGGINFQKLIFGDQGEDGNAAIGQALEKSYQSIQQISDFVVNQYQRQIDKRQEVIDHYNQSIEELESNLDREKDLRDQGLANNVDAIQAEITAQKSARDEQMRLQEEAQRKQTAARKAQLALDTIIQASNLITAATEIFASLAPIPFIGIPLAISTIALMSGAFIAAKVMAFQAVGDKQTFGGGGYIDGPAHTAGGKKYRAMDGSGDVVEVEGGEFVSNKKAVSKYGDLLEAINNDDISGMSDAALRGLLLGMGIHFENDKPREALEISRQHDSLKMIFVPGEDLKPELSSINNNVSYLADQQRNRTEKWQDENYEYTRKGNKTTKIKKN